ncbi:MAG TPA: Gfo/Idh/MocA family oxidoreductase [Blastocatellia bacterium]|nr:Gfo/Idh/MocA family oxidoreductase [Blastocatellia bacterium]
MENANKISRRAFVSASAASVVATAASANRVLGANNRLRVGIIGCGGLAQGAHIPSLMKMKEADNLEIVAVCDVYQKRLDQAAATTGAAPVKDYRAILDNKDVDYVTIVTPEHWHARMTLDAADAGKHIYCEKPMTWSIEQAKQVVKKIQQTSVKMQVGVQGMCDDSYETAQKYIKEGKLGRVVQAQIDYSRNYKRDFWVSDEPDKDVRPGENLDWNAFLGPAPKRPFDLDRFLHWRRYWDYSGGIATDLFVHRITRIIRALDLKFPNRVVAVGGKWEFRDSPAEIPDTFNMMLDYPDGLSVVVLASMANDAPIPHVLRGHEATLEFTREGFVIRPQGRFNKEGDKPEIVHKKSGGEDITLHHRNLQNAIRGGEALKCDVMTGYYGVVAVRLAVESYRKSKYMKWDARREKGIEA